MIKFYKHLYIGESIKNPEKVKWKLKVNAGQLSIFVITLAEGSDQLEFYHAAFLKQKILRKHLKPYVVGIAGGREEAFLIIEGIVSECFEATGDANLKNYLLEIKQDLKE
ncbi:MAG: hypothetical protein FWC09_05295 [Lachnospiraceae bacterium]|nr:hypothetical protein [Lachnospiraceae bacterium]